MFISRFYITLCLSVFSMNTIADDIDHSNDTDEVMVVIGKIPRPVSDVVGSTTIISSEQIDNELVHNISDLVRYQPGISIDNAGTRFGQSGFSIRGINGNRVTTEIDGIPVSDQFDIGTYSNSGRNTIDTDLIQQVEILRGPASSIYGSDAIGGVVSFITKKPMDLLSQSDKDYYLGLKTGYHSVDSSKIFSANTAFGNNTSSALLSFTFKEGNELENQAVSGSGLDTQNNETKSLLAKYHYNLSENQELSFSYDYFNRQADTVIGSFIGTGRFSSTTGLSADDESRRQNIALNYEFIQDHDWLEGGVVRFYQQKTKTQQLTDETRFSRGVNYFYDRDFFYEQDVTGLHLNFYADPSSTDFAHTIGYGFEWSKTSTTEMRSSIQTNLDTGSSTNVVLSEVFPLRDFPISDVTEYGLYINDQINIKKTNWSIVPAIRYDSYQLDPQADAIYLTNNDIEDFASISEDSIAPKLGAIYQLNDASQFYAQYIRGFRAPPFEDANIGLFIPMFNMRAIPNPDLKSEKSNGYELGFNLDDGNHKLDLAIYYNEYEDFIQTKKNLGFDPTLGMIIFQSQNIDQAKIYGAELSYQYLLTNWYAEDDQLTTSVSLYSSKGTNKVTDEPLNNIEPAQLLVGLNWLSPEQNWSISLHSTLVAAKDDLDESAGEMFKTAGYATFDLIGNIYISNETTLSFAINNLGDRKYWQWSAVAGMIDADPIIESLSAPGINGSIQLKIQW